MGESFRTWGRLLRLSLAPTAIADVVCGGVLSGSAGHAGLDVFRLVLASLCIYHGGMALNDWADREEDARVRPDRPIPSGRVDAQTALGFASFLLLFGVAIAATVDLAAGAWAAGIAVLAAVYDLHGRGPWRGPLLLGACRAGNLALPLVALGASPELQGLAWFAPLAYGLYVFVLSRLGRLEDGEAGPLERGTPGRLLLFLALCLLAIPAAPAAGASLWGRCVAAALAVAAAAGLLQRARTTDTWTPGDVMASMGCALRRMLVFTAALACLVGTPLAFGAAAGILLLYPVAWFLRGVFPPS